MTEAAPKMNRMLRNELVFYILMVAVCVDCISELVRRRHAGDVFQNYNSSTRFTCNEGNNLTYLVNEGQCKNQQELLNGCNFSITPSEEFSSLIITLAITDRQNSSLLMIAATVNSLSMLTDAVVVYRETDQPVNSSLCFISYLEIYRGRDQIIEIESDGFSLNERGFIEINSTNLAYSSEEYLGELYRMNLSCSDEGLPESGCLFFKVIGQTNVTSAKFNNRVPGTVYGMEEDATTTTMAISTSTTESVSSFASTTQETLFSTTQTTNTTETPISAAGVDTNVLIYVIYAVSVVGVVALLVVVILLCAVIAYLCCSTDKNKTKREAEQAVTLTDLTPATVPVDIPITQVLPPPPECDFNPAYTFTDSSWNEGSKV